MKTITVTEAAAILGLDPRAVRYAIENGKLAARTEDGPSGPRYAIPLVEVLDYQKRRGRQRKRFEPSTK
ncbi:hypothetical protein AMJ39_08230 [candidate division TA06 bacterium DG_24]|uniref:Helix-turn-helix domain-containing protein n=1 Tax=candidate division TA06 bacterium DG_24 TaxID=1703770 RepID=A0A0S7WQ24_UNCT6|nr:MAG: hypothetical protein AMJ39_08230 [candidate division TA06 bacterium DG_24]